MSNFTKKELLSLLHMHLQEGYARRGYLPLVTQYNKSNKQDPLTFHDLMRTYYPKLYAFLIDNVDDKYTAISTRYRGCSLSNESCMKRNLSLNTENWTFTLKQYVNTISIYMLLFLYIVENGEYSFDVSGSVFTLSLNLNNPNTHKAIQDVRSGKTFYNFSKDFYTLKVNGLELPTSSLNVAIPITILFNHREL